MNRALVVGLLLLTWCCCTLQAASAAFVATSPKNACITRKSVRYSTCFKALSLTDSSSRILVALQVLPTDTSVTDLIPTFSTTPSSLAADVFGVLQAIGAVILVGIALLFGLAFVFANVVIPAAAKQLEEQARSMDPELWKEFEAKLNPGQTLTERPDLIQELGNKLQKELIERMEAAEKEQQQVQGVKPLQIDTVVDAVVEKEEPKKDESNQ